MTENPIFDGKTTNEMVKYTSYQIEIGGDSPQGLLDKLKAKDIPTGGVTETIITMPGFVISKNPTKINVVKLPPEKLGLTGFVTEPEILKAAGNFGLGRCPVETGPYAILQDPDVWGNSYSIATSPINLGENRDCIFKVIRNNGGLVLDVRWFPLSSLYTSNEYILFLVKQTPNLSDKPQPRKNMFSFLFNRPDSQK
jgi:hypothetical protein